MIILAIILTIPVLFLFFLMIIDKHSDNKWFCNFWGWHHPEKSGYITFDGCSMKSKCRRCKKEILRDGNGDWF